MTNDLPHMPAQTIAAPRHATLPAMSPGSLGMLLGFIGVLAFSFTLPLTRIAAPELGGFFVGIGRALLAAAIAIAIVAVRRDPWPERRHWRPLALVALGTVFGFGPLVSIAMEHLPAVHGVVVVGLLPAATAVMAVLRAGEHPSVAFWLACAAGVVAVLIFAVVQRAGRPQPGDALLLAAVLLAALGYAEGGRMAREMGGWRVICWALVFSMPILIVLTGLIVFRDGVPSGSADAWWSFLYLGSISMLLGFFPWYRGLAIGGVARIGQIQLVQPVMSLAWAALMLGEHISTGTAIASVLVIASAALSRFTRGR
jgi:drug/metabolite transporter (DMT)-like permease